MNMKAFYVSCNGHKCWFKPSEPVSPARTHGELADHRYGLDGPWNGIKGIAYQAFSGEWHFDPRERVGKYNSLFSTPPKKKQSRK